MKKEKTFISPQQKIKTLYFYNFKYKNFWLKNNPINTKTTIDNIKNFYGNYTDLVYNLETAKNSSILIYTEKLDSDGIIKLIFNISKPQNKNRIYLITNKIENEKYLESLKYVFIRTKTAGDIKNLEEKFIGSFILINPKEKKSKGYFLPMALTTLSNESLIIELNKNQIEYLHRYFSYNFWENTNYEIINGKITELSNKEYKTPIYVYPNKNDFCDMEYVKKELSKYKDENYSFLYIPKIEKNDPIFDIIKRVENTTIITSKESDFDIIKNLSLENEIYAFDYEQLKKIKLPIFYGNSKFIYIFPKQFIENSNYFYAIKLEDNNQKEKIEKIFNELKKFHVYKFIPEEIRQNLINKEIIYNGKVINIKESKEVDLGKIKLSELINKDSFENYTPKNIGDDGKNVKITYRYKIIPFYTPNNSTKDKLYSEWEYVKLNFERKLNEIEELIIDLKLNEEKNIIKKLKKLKDELPTKSKEERKRINKSLNELYYNLLTKEKEKITKKLEYKRKELKNKDKIPQDKLKQLEQEIKTLEEEIKDLNTKIDTTKNYLNRKNKEQIDEEKTSLQMVVKNVSNKNNNTPKKEKDKNIEEKLESLESLPKIGILYANKNEKYLEIEFWEDYEEAKEEAQRLKAKLSAKKQN